MHVVCLTVTVTCRAQHRVCQRVLEQLQQCSRTPFSNCVYSWEVLRSELRGRHASAELSYVQLMHVTKDLQVSPGWVLHLVRATKASHPIHCHSHLHVLRVWLARTIHL